MTDQELIVAIEHRAPVYLSRTMIAWDVWDLVEAPLRWLVRARDPRNGRLITRVYEEEDLPKQIDKEVFQGRRLPSGKKSLLFL